MSTAVRNSCRDACANAVTSCMEWRMHCHPHAAKEWCRPAAAILLSSSEYFTYAAVYAYT